MATGTATSISCPACSGQLRNLTPQTTQCASCHKKYPQVGDVLILDQDLAAHDWHPALEQLANDAVSKGWREAAKATRRSARWLVWPGQATPLLGLDLPQGSNVLDLGCSSGARAFGLACAGHKVVGVGSTLPLLHFAQARARQEEIAERLQYIACRPTDFKASDASFDMVILEAPSPGLIARARKWLRPGGALVCVSARDRAPAGDPLWHAVHYPPKNNISARELKRALRTQDMNVQATLLCLPSWQEPNSVVRLGDWPSLKQLLANNREKLRSAQPSAKLLGLKCLSWLTWLMTPLLSLSPRLARLLVQDTIIIARHCRTQHTTQHECSFFSEPPASLLSNHASSTWQSNKTIIRHSLGSDTASREGETLRYLHNTLEPSAKDHIPKVISVASATPHYGHASYEKVPSTEATTDVDEEMLLVFLKSLSQVEAVQEQAWCKAFQTMSYICFDVTSNDFADAVNKAEQYLPMNRITHGDLHKDNLLATREGFVVIDWESAGRGHPWFDWIRFRVRQQGIRLRVTDAQAGVASVNHLLSIDTWAQELFGDTMPECIRELTLYYVFLCEDFTGMKELHLRGVPKGMAMLGEGATST